MANNSLNHDDQSEKNLENIRQLIRQLPDEQRLRLNSMLDEEFQTETERPVGRRVPPVVPPDEFAAKWEAEQQWLNQNREQYAGRWVALDSDRLVTAGASAREVYAKLKVAGIHGALVTRVEHPEDLSIIE